MRIAETTLSAIIAFALVYIVYQNDRGNSIPLSSTSNNYTIAINSVPTSPADTVLTIPVTVSGEINEKIQFLFRYAPPKMRDIEHLYRYSAAPLIVADSAAGLYKTILRTGTKGTSSYYYFELRDPIGRNIAELLSADGQPLTTLAIGKVDNWVKYGYYICLSLASLLVTSGAFGSIGLLAGKSEAKTVGKTFMAAAIFTALAVFILGNLYQLQLVAGGWQGAPWGVNISDNLKQILALYLVFMTLTTKIIKTKSGRMQTVFHRNMIGYLGIISFFVMIIALVCPMFVRPNYEHISLVFYAFLTVLAVGYFLVFRRTKHA